MEFFLKLWYFVRTGRTTPETPEEEQDRKRRKEPLTSGFKVILITFVVLAIVAKLVLELLTGNSIDLDVRGLATGFAWLWFASIVVFFIVILRKLFIWRYGEATPYGAFKPGGGCGVVVLVIVGIVGLLTLYIRRSYEASLEQKTAPLAVVEPEPKVERADDTGSAERKPLIARLEVLYSTVNSRWRGDLISAGAVGAPGQIPPMLDVTAVAADVWQVKNLAKSPACVRLARVTESPNGRLNRCRLDATTECVEISVGKSREISLAPRDSSPGCADSRLEFRVGTPTLPEPSWWSATAMIYQEASDSLPGKSYENWTAARLRSEITLLESLPAESNRSARWRREIDDLAHRAKP